MMNAFKALGLWRRGGAILEMSNGKHILRPATAIMLWAAMCLAGAFYGKYEGLRGHAFLATLAALAILLAGEIWLAAPAVQDGLLRTAGPQGGAIMALWPVAAYAIYAA